MRTTQYLLATLKTAPKNCEITSHQLMLRSGMIRQVAAGLYTWLPTGVRVLRKIENIIREEMNKIGFIEMFMPIIQPISLWEKSGRLSEYGKELLRFKNRNGQEFVLSPTHEEMIAHCISKETISHTQFPVNIYQIYTKYRDETRPQFGMIRSKEFIMKDGYSFHINSNSLQHTYRNVYQTYRSIFARLGIRFSIVQADPGNMGGTLSHEFQAHFTHDINEITKSSINNKIRDSNIIHNDTESNNIEFYTTKETMTSTKIVSTTYMYSKAPILSNKFNLSSNKIIKIIIVKSNNKYTTNNAYNFLGLAIQYHHRLSYKKLAMLPEINFPLSIIHIKTIKKIIGVTPTLSNLINLSIPIIIDHHVTMTHNFNKIFNINVKFCQKIKENQHVPLLKIADLCESSKKKHDKLNKKDISTINNNIEIGHIFQLGEKYTQHTNDHIYHNNKNNLPMIMGCYGIGVSRIIPVVIEQNYDQQGIVWPNHAIAPFKLAIIPINLHHSDNVRNVSEKLYNQIISIINIDVLIDDRKERPGIIFTDIDLLGIPHVLIISDRNLNNSEVEYKHRKTGIIKKIKLNIVLEFLIKELTEQ